MLKRLITAVVAAPLVAAASAHAQPVTGFGGGTFSNLSSCDFSGSDRDCRIVSTSHGTATQVQWGSRDRYRDFVNPSTLTAVDVGFDTTAPASALEIGRLEWYNSATLRLDSSLDQFGVRLSLFVNFTRPSGPDPNGHEIFNFSIVNPINPAGDRIYGFALTDLHNLAGSINLSGVELSNFRYRVTDGAGTGTSYLRNNWWYNDEYNHSTLSILADVRGTVSPIPEPATYGMLLAGLAVVGFGVRRRRESLTPRV